MWRLQIKKLYHFCHLVDSIVKIKIQTLFPMFEYVLYFYSTKIYIISDKSPRNVVPMSFVNPACDVDERVNENR